MIAPLLALAAALPLADGPIRLHPENPHYFQFRGEPTVLITSGEHYGAVLNLDFDHAPYLDELARRGFNLTRTFSGTYREVPASFNIRENTLAPRPGRYQAPWAMQGDRYDLDRFDPAYFERLRSFLAAADERGVVVELVLYCPIYEDALWDVNPMNGKNNVNGVGNVPREEVYTLKHRDLLERQLALVDRLAREVNGADNLYFEVCNEPYFGGVTGEWQDRVIEAIVEAESDLPKRHLIARNIANGRAKVDHPNPAVSIYNFHYATPPATVAMNYGLDRPIADDETGFKGTGDRVYRTEAWEFLLAGGAAFSHLDYSFTPDREDGTAKVEPPTPGGGGPEFRSQLAFLKRWFERINFVRMRPDESSIRVARGELAEGGRVWCLSEPGKRYAAYLRGGKDLALTLDLPDGPYAFGLVDPRDGRSLGGGQFEIRGGPYTLDLPEFAEDLALAIEARAE